MLKDWKPLLTLKRKVWKVVFFFFFVIKSITNFIIAPILRAAEESGQLDILDHEDEDVIF